jgi:hypothetical protein
LNAISSRLYDEANAGSTGIFEELLATDFSIGACTMSAPAVVAVIHSRSVVEGT